VENFPENSSIGQALGQAIGQAKGQARAYRCVKMWGPGAPSSCFGWVQSLKPSLLLIRVTAINLVAV